MHYSELCAVYEELDATQKRLEKTHIISEFLKRIKDQKDLDKCILLLMGKLYPDYDNTKIGMAARTAIKAICLATGATEKQAESEWKKHGDLGIAAQNLIGKKKQQSLYSKKLSVNDVFANIRKLASLSGAGTVEAKVGLVAELLTSATPLEARYIIKTVLEEMRAGMGEGTMRDAIVWAYFGKELGINYVSEKNDIGIEDRERYNEYAAAVQDAYNVVLDFAAVAEMCKGGIKALQKVSLKPGQPIKVMLAQKVGDIKEGFEVVGRPAALEYKYDGFRMLVSIDKKEIRIFTRRMENVTTQFPDVVAAVKEHISAESAIIDCEAVGFSPKTGKYIAFQKISQRIKRKYNIDEIKKEFPVELNVFDIVFYNGKSLLQEKFSERRKLVEKIVKHPEKLNIKPSNYILTDDDKKAAAFYKESLAAGCEGIMLKNLSAPYKPGSRVGYMIKLKPVMDPLDLVIVGAEWGEGKRAKWLSSFILACRDNDSGEYLEIGRVGTGFKEKTGEDVSFEQLTELLKPLITSEKGMIITVKPRIVLAVDYEEIQKSPTYSSGYALRFPRVKEIRDDRNAESISTLEEVEEAYKTQRGRDKPN